MRVFDDIPGHKVRIRKGIRKFGHFAEHNYSHYLYSGTESDKNFVFDYGRDRLVLAQFYKSSNTWGLFPEGVLAPEDERPELLLKAAKYTLKKKKAKKFIVEVAGNLRQKLLKKIASRSGLKACSCNHVLYWPMYKMESWDSKLRGSKWKKLRNIKNRFYRKNRVRVVDSRTVPKEGLKSIVARWLNKRKESDRVDKIYYHNLIDNKFKGTNLAKTMYVNGEPRTITAGWKIPNTKNYYSAIGIFDYSYPELGEIANMDDLDRLKKKGYNYADFGGSDSVLLSFKKKFRPEKIYKTYIFSIVER